MNGISLFFFISAIFLGTFFNLSDSRAATIDSTTLECDYLAASTIISYYEPKVLSNQRKGKVTLVKDGKVFRGEATFDIFKMRVEGEFVGGDLSLSVNILDAKYSTSLKIVAIASSLHHANEAGDYLGTLILRSPQVATLAMQADVLYETAPLEKLSTGNNFLGAYLSCQ